MINELDILKNVHNAIYLQPSFGLNENFDPERVRDILVDVLGNDWQNCVPNNDFLTFYASDSIENYCRFYVENTSETDPRKIAKQVIARLKEVLNDTTINTARNKNNFAGTKLHSFFAFFQQLESETRKGNFAKLIENFCTDYLVVKSNNPELRLQRITDKTNKNQTRPIAEIENEIKSIWKFTTRDLLGLRFFIWQTYALPSKISTASENKVLYFWSKKQRTGKTTLSKILASVLNGDTMHDLGNHRTTAAKEMQFNAHDLPLTTKYFCVYADETMPSDTTKSYGKFKTFVTSETIEYNPKFREPRMLKCFCNCIFTSNETPQKFIQDETERRIFSIEMQGTPEPRTEQEIFDLFSEYQAAIIRAGVPTDYANTNDWYNATGDTEGEKRLLKEEIWRAILGDNAGNNRLENTSLRLDKKTSYKQIFDILSSSIFDKVELELLREKIKEIFADATNANRTLSRAKVRQIFRNEIADFVAMQNEPEQEQEQERTTEPNRTTAHDGANRTENEQVTTSDNWRMFDNIKIPF